MRRSYISEILGPADGRGMIPDNDRGPQNRGQVDGKAYFVPFRIVTHCTPIRQTFSRRRANRNVSHLPEIPTFRMQLVQERGVGAETKGKDIIDSQSSRPHFITETVKEAECQIWNSIRKCGQHSTGDRYRIIPPPASRIIAGVCGVSGASPQPLWFPRKIKMTMSWHNSGLYTEKSCCSEIPYFLHRLLNLLSRPYRSHEFITRYRGRGGACI